MWNDTPPLVRNQQEDPYQVEEIARALPDVQFALLFKESCSMYERLKKKFSETRVDEERVVYSGSMAGKRVGLAIADRYLVRAFAMRKTVNVGIGRVIPVDDSVKDAEYVCVGDHVNLSGIFALVGANKSGPRFPDMMALYEDIPDLTKVVAFNMADVRIATPAFASGIAKLGCQVIVEFGPEQATITRHQGGTFKYLGVVVHSTEDDWNASDDLLSHVLQ